MPINDSNTHSLHQAIIQGDDLLAIFYITELYREDINLILISGDYIGMAPIHIATLTKNIAMIPILVANGADIHKAVDNGTYTNMTALHIAAQDCDREVVLTLIENAAKVNEVNENHCTPLHYALNNRNSETAMALIEHGGVILPYKLQYPGYTSIHMALEKGLTEVAIALIDKLTDFDAATEGEYKGMNYLHIASSLNNKEVVQHLLNKKFNVNLSATEEDRYEGMTSLHIAIHEKHAEIAMILIEHGIIFCNDEEFPGNTSLHYALENDLTDVAIMLIDRMTDFSVSTTGEYEGMSYLHVALICNNHKVALYLINKGLDVNLAVSPANADYSGMPPLRIIMNKFEKENEDEAVEIIMALIEKGANIDAVATGELNLGLTPLHISAMLESKKIVDLLIKSGAKVNPISLNGKTPLHIALRGKNTNVAIALIKNGGVVYFDQERDRGMTLLHMVIEEGLTEIAMILIDQLTDFEAATIGKYEGLTYLHIALILKNKEIALYLIRKFSDVNQIVTKGKYTGHSPLHLSLQCDEIVTRALCEKGADIYKSITSGADNGYISIHLAVKYGNIATISTLIEYGASIDYLAHHNDVFTSPLNVSIMLEKSDVAIFLIKSGADIHSSITYPSYITTNMIYAASKNLWDVVTTLVDLYDEEKFKVADVVIGDNSTLSYAIASKRNDIIYLLLEKNARLCIKRDMLPIITSQSVTAIQCDDPEINDNQINKIYNPRPDFARAKEITGAFKEGSGEYKNRMTDEPFYDEIKTLMHLFAELSVVQETKNNFISFIAKIQNPSHFSQDKSDFYMNMKTGLEHIYIAYRSSSDETQVKESRLKILSEQLNVCGPGIFNSITDIRSDLLSGDLVKTLARYRKEIVLKCAAIYIVKNAIIVGMHTHVDADFIMHAETLGYYPLGGRKQLEYGDLFAGRVVNVDIAQSSLHNAFKKQYNFFGIYKYIKLAFTKELANYVATDDWFTLESYENHRLDIERVVNTYGLSFNNKIDKIFEFNDDYTLVKLNTDAILFCLIESLVGLKFINATISELEMHNSKIKVNYFIHNRSVHARFFDANDNPRNFEQNSGLYVEIIKCIARDQERVATNMPAIVYYLSTIAYKNNVITSTEMTLYISELDKNKDNIIGLTRFYQLIIKQLLNKIENNVSLNPVKEFSSATFLPWRNLKRHREINDSFEQIVSKHHKYENNENDKSDESDENNGTTNRHQHGYRN